MGESRLNFTIPNRLEEVTPACQRVEAFLRDRNAHPRVVYCAQLVCEELVTNVIRYGFSDDQRHEIDVALAMDNGDLQVTIEDDGVAFDSESHAAPQPGSLEEADVGGRGLQLVRRMSDDFSMQRENEKNICRVRISPPRNDG